MSRDEAATIGRNAIDSDATATQRLIEGYDQLSKALDTESRYKRDAVSSLKEATEREAKLKDDNRKLAAAATAAKSDGIEKAKLAVTKAVAAAKTKHELSKSSDSLMTRRTSSPRPSNTRHYSKRSFG